jgi:hypothetical protein
MIDEVGKRTTPKSYRRKWVKNISDKWAKKHYRLNQTSFTCIEVVPFHWNAWACFKKLIPIIIVLPLWWYLILSGTSSLLLASEISIGYPTHILFWT